MSNMTMTEILQYPFQSLINTLLLPPPSSTSTSTSTTTTSPPASEIRGKEPHLTTAIPRLLRISDEYAYVFGKVVDVAVWRDPAWTGVWMVLYFTLWTLSILPYLILISPILILIYTGIRYSTLVPPLHGLVRPDSPPSIPSPSNDNDTDDDKTVWTTMTTTLDTVVDTVVGSVSDAVETVTETVNDAVGVVGSAMDGIGKGAGVVEEVAREGERVRNVIQWKSPEKTGTILITYIIFITVLCISPWRLIRDSATFFLGYYFFIVQGLRANFPRYRLECEPLRVFWEGVPTDDDVHLLSSHNTSITPSTGTSRSPQINVNQNVAGDTAQVTEWKCVYVSDGDKSVSYPGFIKLSSTHLTFTSPDQTIELETSNIHIRHHPDGDGVEVVRGGKVHRFNGFESGLYRTLVDSVTTLPSHPHQSQSPPHSHSHSQSYSVTGNTHIIHLTNPTTHTRFGIPTHTTYDLHLGTTIPKKVVRYSDFVHVHSLLTQQHNVGKSTGKSVAGKSMTAHIPALPPKKAVGRFDPIFVEERRRALEAWCRVVDGLGGDVWRGFKGE